MAKGQKRSNREPKKPKSAKKKTRRYALYRHDNACQEGMTGRLLLGRRHDRRSG